MDGAQVPRMIYFRYSTGNTLYVKCCQVGGRVKVRIVLLGSCIRATACGTAFSADLGGSSKYSSFILCLRTEVEKGFISIASTYE